MTEVADDGVDQRPASAEALIRRCERQAGALVARIKLHLSRGDRVRASREQDRLLSSFAGRLAAAAAVNRRQLVARRLAADALVTLAPTLDLHSPSTQPVVERLMEKGDGGHRQIWSFQFEDKVRQVLARRALEPFLEVLPSQFTLRGDATRPVRP